jgi:hypothetical protein
MLDAAAELLVVDGQAVEVTVNLFDFPVRLWVWNGMNIRGFGSEPPASNFSRGFTTAHSFL